MVKEIRKKFKDLTVEERKKWTLLEEFSSEFIKALLKTSYYTPDHPSSQKAKEGLFEKLGKIVEDRYILTFSREIEEKQKDVNVEGIFEGSVSLLEVMGYEKGNLYVPKLWDFMSRKRLISLSIKPSISYDEFDRCLNILAEAPQQAYTEEDSKRVTMLFVEKGLSNVLPVFEEDILGRERKLSWMVRIVLSRLKKDLKLLPLYRNLTEERIAEIKKQIFREILRPLRRIDVLTEFLEHTDLIKADVKLLDEKEIEREIVNNLPQEITSLLAKKVAERIKEIENIEEAKDMKANLLIALAFLCDRLTKSAEQKDIETVASIYRMGFLKIESLPPEVREFIHLQNEMIEFLSSRKIARELFVEVSRRNYEKKLSIMVSLFEELIKKNKEPLAMEIIEVLDAIRKEESIEWKKNLAESALSRICSNDEVLALIAGLLLQGKEVERGIKIFELSGEHGIYYLLEVLKTSESRAVRRKVIETILKKKDYAITYILQELEKGEGEWFYIRNLIFILREMGDKQSFHIVARYLNYPHFRVKEEAIDYLLQANEKVLLDEAESLMDDKDERIRRKIIQALTTLKTKRKEIVLKAVSMLMDENESEEVKKAILSFFSSIRNLKLPDGKTIEGVLIDFIERKKKVFIFKKEESPELKKHAIKILGEIGSTKAIPFLRTLEGKKEYAEEAKMAIKRIAERISSVRK